MPQLTIADLLEKALSWEIAARDLYIIVSNAFPGYPDVQETWRRMAADESMHASILRKARAEMSATRLAEPLVPAQIERMEAVDQAFALAATTPLTCLNDVYELAHDLESSEVNAVFLLLVTGEMDDDSASALLKSQFDEHIGRLTDLAEQFDRTARQLIALKS